LKAKVEVFVDLRQKDLEIQKKSKVLAVANLKLAEAHRKLLERTRVLELATASGHLGVWDWDVATGKVVWDARMLELYGVAPESFSGRVLDFQKALHPEDLAGVNGAIRAAIKGEKEYTSVEYRVVHPDGTVRVIKADGLVTRDASGRAVRMIGLSRDVTELWQAREDMLKTQKLESLGVLAGGLAHDFNNILTAVFGNISLARFQLDDTGTADQRLEDAEHAIGRATDLTKQLLTFARGGEPVKKIITIPGLLREAAQSALLGSTVDCAFVLEDDVWPVEADGGQLAQVIHNLVLNAVQAMPGGGTVTVGARNVSSQATAGRFVRISVGDEGVGIPVHNLSRIFDPYYTTNPQGNGLGLATSYSIIRKHGGKIRAASTVGAGSTFYISLPASEQRVVSDPSASKAVIHGSGRVLVMDDDASVRSIAQGLLNQLGYTVEAAAHGVEALGLYLKRKEEGTPFCAAILDLTVHGGMGGKETVRKLREIDPGLKAIVSSGYSNDPVMANYRDYGFAAVLSKPYRPQEMSRILSDVLGPLGSRLHDTQGGDGNEKI
jgi:PAS domain S-box-containing protein